MYDAGGKSKLIDLKHGTEVADGAWSEVKHCFPKGIKSAEHERIAEYIYAWAWKARRTGQDLLTELSKAIV